MHSFQTESAVVYIYVTFRYVLSYRLFVCPAFTLTLILKNLHWDIMSTS